METLGSATRDQRGGRIAVEINRSRAIASWIEDIMNVPTQRRTRMFARVLGPFIVTAMVVALVRVADMRRLLTEFTASDVWPYLTGAYMLLGGIAIVAFHQIWRGAAAIIVSVLGLLLVVRGFVLLAFPDVFASLADRMMGIPWAWIPIFVVMAVIGVYLTYVGWRPMPKQMQGESVHVEIDFSQAA
jgi:hypothetical protein